MNVEIPRLLEHDDPGPGWIAVSDGDGKPLKPLIKCQCGKICGIGLHHVHPDGRITASFYHSEASEFTEGGRIYRHTPGCGWHVFLKLKDYDRGEFPSERP